MRDTEGLVWDAWRWPPSHTEPCGMGSRGAQEGFVLLWALGFEGVSLWEQRDKRDVPGWAGSL